MEYLDFEDSIKKLVDKIVETKKINNEDDKIDLTDTIKNLVLRDINNIIQNSSPNVLQQKNNLETQYQQLIQQCV